MAAEQTVQPSQALGSGGEPGLADLAGRRARNAIARARSAITRAERAEALIAVAEARALAAEQELAALRSSKAWRITWPLRRAAHAVPPSLYALIGRGGGRGGPAASAAMAALPAGAPVGPAVFLMDHAWPSPDRDAGSIEVMNLAEALQALGYEVHFAVILVGDPGCGEKERARRALADRGMICLPFEDEAALRSFLQREGGRYRLFVLNRVYNGGSQFEHVRACSQAARVVFNTIDLHYVRAVREAALFGNPVLAALGETMRAREEFLAGAADATFVVTDTERLKLEAAVPGCNVFTLPLARPVQRPRAAFSVRRGIGFIGGFAHPPNVDAVRFFLREVWPLVLECCPECRFSIVGADLPGDVLERAAGEVDYLGHVPDVGPWFETLRMTVAPLRYGAGMKGKVVSSLAAGVPCVMTGIAAEGIGLQDGAEALIADDAAGLARHIVRLHGDELLWARLSAASLEHVSAHLSPESWRGRLRDALWTIDALPGAGDDGFG